MLTFTKIALTGILCLAHFAGDGPDPLKVKPVKTIAGGDSKVDFPLVRILQTQKAWRELWAIHLGLPLIPEENLKGAEDPEKPPEVDFTKNQVLVVLGGHMANVKAYSYVKTFAKDETAVIQLGQTLIPDAEVKDMMHPYVFLVIPREPVPIEVQLDSIAKDGSHFWMTLASFKAPKETKG
jgi:hypothetical protein